MPYLRSACKSTCRRKSAIERASFAPIAFPRDIIIGDDTPLQPHIRRARYVFAKADWRKFRSLVGSGAYYGTADAMAKHWSRNIATAKSRAVPKGTYKCPESWSAELEAATRTCEVMAAAAIGDLNWEDANVHSDDDGDETRELFNLLTQGLAEKWTNNIMYALLTNGKTMNCTQGRIRLQHKVPQTVGKCAGITTGSFDNSGAHGSATHSSSPLEQSKGGKSQGATDMIAQST